MTTDVIVVDDDGDAVEELVECLAKANVGCKAALDAWGALKLLAEGFRPSVVVADLRMPELSGVEFAEKLRQLGEADRPEVIFISGHAGFDDAIAAIRLGARDLLVKPVDGPRLVQAVKTARLAHQMRRRSGVTSEHASRPQEAGPDRKRVALGDLRAVRRVRGQYFSSELFADPNWEMLLDLYDAALAHQDVTISSLGAASGVPLTTALRRMDTLQNHGLIQRAEDKQDRRRIIVKLTDAGLNAVERFFESYVARQQRS
jgi:FixJ family two-component response regulator